MNLNANVFFEKAQIFLCKLITMSTVHCGASSTQPTSIAKSNSALINLLLATSLLASCKIWNPSKVYNTQRGDLAEIHGELAADSYRIQPGDRLSMFIYTNSAYKLVDAGLASFSGGQAGGSTSQITYLVEKSGVARFPMIDTALVVGYTLAEATARLEARYSSHLVDPWVQLHVVNRRAFVYRGSSDAAVVSLPNEDMTLLEVIASAGGIPATGKAYRINLVREGPQGPILYGIDLRDGTNLHAGQTIVRANDVILIDPTFETTFVTQLTPFLAVITSGIAVYGLFRSLRP